MSLPKKIWKSSRFHKGISDLNNDGNFWFSNGLEFDQNPPFLKVATKFFKESDSIGVPTLNKPSYACYFNYRYYAVNHDDGKVFENTYNSWTEVHDSVNIWGGSGLYADDDYMYYAGSTWVGRFDKNTWIDNWQSFNVNTAFDDVPITKFLKFICFGNKNYLATWDTGASAWNPSRLTLPTGYVIMWLAPLTDYLIISAHHQTFGSALFFWDGYSQTYNRVLQLTQTQSLAGVVDKNVLYFLTRDGWICRFNGSGIEKLNRFPDMANEDYISLKAECMKVYKGLVYILKGSNTFDVSRRHQFCGIWCYNPATNALYFKHRLSNNAISHVTPGIAAVYCLYVDNTSIRAMYTDGNKSIIDVNSDGGTFRPYDFGAYWISPLLDDEPYLRKRWKQIILNFFKPISNSSWSRFELKYNTTEQTIREVRSVNGGGSDYFTLSSINSSYEVGDEVIVIAGPAAGQIRHIKSIDTATNTIYLDEYLYYRGTSQGYIQSGDYVAVTPFKRLATIKGNENQNKVNKMLRFNARSKKIQFKIDIWSNSGYGGEWDMGLKDVSAVYVPDRIIK